jgi:YaaC-like protein
MPVGDRYDLKFLESASNVRGLLKKSTGRSPSAQIAGEVAACVEQGRAFFEIASEASPQIRPLQIYYGVVSFAKAVIIGRTFRSIDTIAQSHGLSDISSPNAKIEELRLSVLCRGVFQEFSEVVGEMGCISYYDERSMLTVAAKPFDSPDKLSGKSISIKEIFARVPTLDGSFKRTFDEDGRTFPFDYMKNYDMMTLRIWDDVLFIDIDNLISIIDKWRSRFPFLNQWCFSEATHAWNKTLIAFTNTEKPAVGEFASELLIKLPNTISLSLDNRSGRFIPFTSIVPALAGGITHQNMTVMCPYDDVLLSEFSLQFMGSFLLSSLVRYRPQIWQKAISRSISQSSPADDRALALIEQFNDLLLSNFPDLVTHSLGLRQ